MGRVGHLRRTLDGIESCLSLGLTVKVNMVVIKNENDNEVIDMLKYGVKNGIEIRYLELMGMGLLHKKNELSYEKKLLLLQDKLKLYLT